jgi:hypothetical protein
MKKHGNKKSLQWENPDSNYRLYTDTMTYEETLSVFLSCGLLFTVMDKDLRLLKRMYSLLGIDNGEIYQQSITSSFYIPESDNAIFYDMVALISDKAKEDSVVFSVFNEALHAVFGDLKSIPQANYPLREYPRLYANKAIFDQNRSSYSELASHLKQQYLMRKDSIFGKAMDAPVSFNTGEPIFEDPLFKKYMGRRLEELSEYCNRFYNRTDVTTENIYEVLLEGMRHHSAQLEQPLHDKCVRTKYFQVYGGINNMVTRTLNRLGGPTLLQVTSPVTVSEGKAHLPDIEALVNDFYREYIRIRLFQHMTDNWVEASDSGPLISKLYLSRECIPDPAYVHSSIHFLFNIEVLNHLYEELRKKYYLDFSWEKQNYIASEQALKDDLSEMRRMLSDAQSRLDSANEKVLFYKAQAGVSRMVQNSPDILARTESMFEKKLDQKDEEIARLRKQLAFKDAYIELISQPDEEIATPSYDKDIVVAHKYLFVGRWQEAYPELKKTFPNSVFLDSPAKDISADVDAVVFLIKCMSHALFYKVQNAAALNEVPRVYCNNRNINNIYANIYEQLKKSGE